MPLRPHIRWRGIDLIRHANSLLLLACLGLPSLPAAAGEANETLEPVLITALRLPANQFALPMAVTTLDAKDMAGLAVTGFDGAVLTVPNLSMQYKFGPGAPPLFLLRGQEVGVVSLNADLRAVLYLDDVPVGRAGALSGFMLANLCGMETLRGPQGAVYGANAAAGVIRLTSCAPLPQASAQAMLEIGNLGHRQAKLTIDTGEHESLATRLVVQRQQNDGWVSNETPGVVTQLSAPFGSVVSARDFGSLRSDALSLSARYQGLSGLSLDYRFDWNRKRSTQTAIQLLAVYGDVAGLYDPAAGVGGTVPQLQARSSVAADFTGTDRQQVDGHALSIEYAWSPALRAKAVLATRHMAENAGGNDLDAASFNGDFLSLSGVPTPRAERVCYLCSDGVRHLRQTSAELNLLARVSSGSQVTVGLLGLRESGRSDAPTLIGAPLQPGALNVIGSLSQLAPSDYYAGTQIAIRNESLAAFGYGTYEWTERWSLRAGLRRTQDRRNTDTLRSAGPSNDSRAGFAYNDWDVALLRRLSDELNAYVRLGTAHVSGGSQAGEIFLPEVDRGAEAGLKFNRRDRRLDASLALFRTQIDHLHSESFSPKLGTYVLDNGSATNSGAELELRALAMESLELRFSYGYVHARLAEGFKALAPAQTLYLGAIYQWARMANGLMPALRVDATWRDRAATGPCQVAQTATPSGCPGNGDAALTHAVTLPAHSDFSLRLSLAGLALGCGPQGELAFWVRNLLDARPLQFARDLGNGTVVGTFAAPRTLGLSLSSAF